jgi:hypothetical protein
MNTKNKNEAAAAETAKPTYEQLLAENQQFKAAQSAEQEGEKMIAERMRWGLPRDKAIAAIEQEKAWKARVAEQRAKRLPALVEIIKDCKTLRDARLAVRAQMPEIEYAEVAAAFQGRTGKQA